MGRWSHHGLIACPSCGSPLSADNAVCPYCSSTVPLNAPWRRGQWWVAVLLASVVAGAWICDRLFGTSLAAMLADFFQAKGS